jgi:haloacetate dehalogenase
MRAAPRERVLDLHRHQPATPSTTNPELACCGTTAFHLYLLAQPNDLPDRLIAADQDTFLGHFLDTWTRQPEAIPTDIWAHYLETARRAQVIHAICDDYRASAVIDATLDENDQRGGRTPAMPALAAWQDPATSHCRSTLAEFGRRGQPISARGCFPGHFLLEERPAEVSGAIAALVSI